MHASAPTPFPVPEPPPRLDSVDALRGLVMVFMALDHTRDFFSNYQGDPVDPATTDAALFFTRWITHFCAPVFVFLAGTGAYFYGRRGRTPSELRRFLFTRGLWLIVLEATLVRWGWRFSGGGGMYEGQVIWALGVSMIVLGALLFLGWRGLLAFGLALVALHDTLDGVRWETPGWRAGLWSVLHEPRPVDLGGGFGFFPLYPLVPWIGVMPLGFAFGVLMERPGPERRRGLIRIAIVAVVLFAALRLTNLYGDPVAWTSQATPMRTVFSFLNLNKYPPSLLFLLATLGPALGVLAVFDAFASRVPRWLVTLGRVPLFYYLAHLYLIHAAAGIVAWLTGRHEHARWVWRSAFFEGAPPGYGYPLWVVYLVWVALVALLYPACRAYAKFKKRSRHPVLSYL
ncbi:MAG: DUF1624 domain-containing protein [Verrucomicrobiales bacterium]|nr:DUF1624 domain-containing protein [Verrucomicrobiales bacterium]